MTTDELIAAAKTFRESSTQYGDIKPGSIIDMWLSTATELERVTAERDAAIAERNNVGMRWLNRVDQVEQLQARGCEHPKEQRYMRGWTEVCGVCGQGRDIS